MAEEDCKLTLFFSVRVLVKFHVTFLTSRWTEPKTWIRTENNKKIYSKRVHFDNLVTRANSQYHVERENLKIWKISDFLFLLHLKMWKKCHLIKIFFIFGGERSPFSSLWIHHLFSFETIEKISLYSYYPIFGLINNFFIYMRVMCKVAENENIQA